MKRLYILLILLILAAGGAAGYFLYMKNSTDFPVATWNGSDEKPLIFYISGDAGFNTFSKGVGNDFQQKGYEVAALNTKKYFWEKKTPEQTSADIEYCIVQKLQSRKNQKVILIGFSFGADVTAFVYNHFSQDLKSKVEKVFIVGPSKTTDFEIHLDEYFGAAPKGSLPVIPEINKIQGVPVTVILSDFEFKYFPYQQITLAENYKMIHLPGDHHYGGNTRILTDLIEKELP